MVGTCGPVNNKEGGTTKSYDVWLDLKLEEDLIRFLLFLSVTALPQHYFPLFPLCAERRGLLMLE